MCQVERHYRLMINLVFAPMTFSANLILMAVEEN